jgi:hypothetical protein
LSWSELALQLPFHQGHREDFFLFLSRTLALQFQLRIEEEEEDGREEAKKEQQEEAITEEYNEPLAVS